ncbi:MAG: hypothetical protein U1E26_01135 [Coriobacteriia bacterium]|nr:hypothetical protein [Coriobacteriia bacterium]
MVLSPFWNRPSSDSIGVLAGKLGAHCAHHRFGRLGHLRHIQLNIWRIGVKGSGRNVRVPLVRLSSVTRLMAWALQSASRRPEGPSARTSARPSVLEVR